MSPYDLGPTSPLRPLRRAPQRSSTTQPVLSLDTHFDGASDRRRPNGHRPDEGECSSTVDDTSPDPHEFYRPFQSPPPSFGAHPYAGGASGLPMGVVIPLRTSSTSSTSGRRPSGHEHWAATTARRGAVDRGAADRPLNSCGATPEASLSPSPSSLADTPVSRTASASGSGLSRSQQPSLRDLVNRFNQNQDESLPLPARPGRRSDAMGPAPILVAAAAAAASSANAGVKRHRTTTRTATGTVLVSRTDTPPQPDRRRTNASRSPRLTPRRQDVASPLRPASTSSSSRRERAKVNAANNPWASRSMTTLHLSTNESANRRPLFGEVLDVGRRRRPSANDRRVNAADAGFGIGEIKPRDADESARPSLSHRRVKSHVGLSPTSPTAWYLGALPAFGGGDAVVVGVGAGAGAGAGAGTSVGRGGSPVPRPSHRRAQSDFAGVLAESPSSFEPRHIAPLDPDSREEGRPQPAPTSPRSRIPLSSRRQSTLSEGAPARSPVSATSSAASTDARRKDSLTNGYGGRGSISSSIGSASGIPRPTSRAAIAVGPARPVTPVRSSSRRYDVNDRSRTDSSPRLKAYVSAPPPTTKSPPLRSSRPRAPISLAATAVTATTSSTSTAARSQASASARARNPHDHGSDVRQRSANARAKPKSPRPVGLVDFAARRERIQRAMTKSVREGEANRQRTRRATRDRERDRDVVPSDLVNGGDSRSSPSFAPLPPLTESPRTTEVRLGEESQGVDRVGADRSQPDGDSSNVSNMNPDQVAAASAAASEPADRKRDPEQLTRAHHEESMDDSPTLGMPGGFPVTPEVVVVVQATATAPVAAATTQGRASPAASVANSNVPATPPPHPQTTETRDPTREVPQAGTIERPTAEAEQDVDMLTLPMTTYQRGAVSDVGDDESIQIMLQSSPILQGQRSSCFDEATPIDEDDHDLGENGYGFPSRPSVAARHDSTDSGGGTHDTAPPDTNQDEVAAAIDHSGEGGNPPHSNHANGEQRGLDSQAYGAINKVLEHYHRGILSSHESVRYFQQQLLTRSPDLARLGGWDSKRVTRLYLQQLGLEASSTSDLALPLPGRDLERARLSPRVERALTEEPGSDTDIESDGAEGEETGEDRPRYQLSEFGWASIRPSLDVDRDVNRSADRASLRLRHDWEDASPSIADWIRPQMESSPETEDAADANAVWHTPPLRSSPYVHEWSEPSVGSPNPSPERDGAATPRLLAVNGTRRSEVGDSAAGGLGLHADVDGNDKDDGQDDQGAVLSTPPLQPPPPIPEYAPPPPPVPEMEDDLAKAGSRGRFKAVYSPPSPSIYSRHPHSTFDPMASPKRPGATRDSSSRTSSGAARTSSQSGPSAAARVRSSRSSDGAQRQATGPASEDAEHGRLKKRRFLIRELLETEKKYHNDVDLTQQVFKATTHLCPELTEEDVLILFGNGDKLVKFSVGFFDALRQAAKSVHVTPGIQTGRSSISTANSGATSSSEDQPAFGPPGSTDDERDRLTYIGWVFLDFLPLMERLYSEHLKNHDAANKRLEQLQPLPYVQHWLQACQQTVQDLTSAWSLDSLLVKPAQRITKYPLLLESLLQLTPADHPDHESLQKAALDMRAVMQRINDLKKRVELVEQVMSRNRKESDVRSGLTRALERGTEKLREKVGRSNNADDPGFNRLAGLLSQQTVNLHLLLLDVGKYQDDVQLYMKHFEKWVQAMEDCMDVRRGIHPELESKWRKFSIVVRELATTALPEHKVAVSTTMIEPLRTALRMYERPEALIAKRSKKLAEYTRYKHLKERGEKIDRRTQENADRFDTLTNALWDELPKLFSLTGKLAEACLLNFVKLCGVWQTTWQLKIQSILEAHHLDEGLDDVVRRFKEDFQFPITDTSALSICNGAALNGIVNMLSPDSARQMDELIGQSRPSGASSRSRTISLNSQPSPGLAAAAASSGDSTKSRSRSGSYAAHYPPPPVPIIGAPPATVAAAAAHRRPNLPHAATSLLSGTRARATSTTSNSGTRSFDPVQHANPSYSSVATTLAAGGGGGGGGGGTGSAHSSLMSGSTLTRPSTAATRNSSNSNVGREMVEVPTASLNRPYGDAAAPLLPTSTAAGSPNAAATAHPTTAFSSTFNPRLEIPGLTDSPSSDRPFSGLFSSAMPMSESRGGSSASPRTSQPASRRTSSQLGDDNTGRFNILFLAASRATYTVDPMHHREAGYPFLSYVDGDVSCHFSLRTSMGFYPPGVFQSIRHLERHGRSHR